MLGNYEHFDYSSQAFNGVLRGDGWTTGAYGLADPAERAVRCRRRLVGYLVDDTSGMATGNFLGHRWLVTGGLTGTYGWQSFVLEPSARIYALLNMKTRTPTASARCSQTVISRPAAPAAAEPTMPFAWSSTVDLAPMSGFTATIISSMDDAATAGLTTVPLLQELVRAQPRAWA